MENPPHMINALTGLRFWAALMVVLFHFAGPGVETHPYLINGIISRGSMGVDLFFVLSGFIIHHVYGRTFSSRLRKQPYLRFLSFRVARMYPVHIFTMGLMFLLYIVAVTLFKKTPPDMASYQFPAILHSLLMTHTWVNVGTPNIPAWSISSEWFMYLLYPAVALALFCLNLVCEWLLLGACIAGVYWLVPLHPLLHIVPEFIFGATLYQINTALQLNRKLGAYTGWLLVAIIMALLTVGINGETVYVVLFGALILALTSEKDRLGQLLARPCAIYLGEISYSLYMIHSFVWSVIKNTCRIIFPSIDIQWVIVILPGIALSILAAALVYRYIEVPGRRFIRHLTDPAANPNFV